MIAAGGMGYFTSAYVNIRVIREVHGCMLPIEVFYAEKEMSKHIIDYMESTFKNVKFVDIQRVPGAPDMSMKGYQIKIFSILLSSFKEVLFLDADNMPLLDPTNVFDIKPYKKTGALFWPDFCNMISARLEMWDILGLERPAVWPSMNPGEVLKWTKDCKQNFPFEFESGQMLINKKKAWPGLVMTAFINKNNEFFQKRFIHGDKQTFSFGFNVSDTPYSFVRKHPIGIGRKQINDDGKEFFCANTFGQRHPISGDIMFMHRSLAKFVRACEYTLLGVDAPRAWTHLSKQDPRSSWQGLGRSKLSDGSFDKSQDVFLPSSAHQSCVHPAGKEAAVRRATPEVRKELYL